MITKSDVAVVGLGAVGSAAIYQLAARHVDVVGIDRYIPPHDRGSSHGETRITRQSVSEGSEYVSYALRSHELWREFEQRTGQTLLEQVGALFLAPTGKKIDAHGGNFVERAICIARKKRIPHEQLNAKDVEGRFPQFKITREMIAYYEPGGGFVRPEACVAAQLDLARQAGAHVEFGTTVMA